MPHDYPRPSCAGTDGNLNGTWRFRFDDDATITHPREIEAWPLQIVVPYPPESHATGIGDRGFHNVCWYERDN